jgi:chemotaxis protein methyltransferase CheR
MSAVAERTAIRPISTHEFDALRGLVHREAGIFLSDAKRALLVGRLSRRLRDLGLSSFGAYYRRVVDGDEAEKIRMLDCLSTNETHFFREPQQFDFLENNVLPAWSQEASAGTRPRRIRAWSSACSTGQEPYSLAMALLDCLPPSSGWDLGILATDLSTRALATARAGVWPLEKAVEIPEARRKAFMLRGTGPQEGKMKAGPEIRSLVRFDRINLNEEGPRPRGPFDLIFCRNVLIYFDGQTKARVIEGLVDQLADGGLLFLGQAETFVGATDRIRRVGPAVYKQGRGRR